MKLHWHNIITQSPKFNTLEFTLAILHSLGLNKGIMTYIHHRSIIQNSCSALKVLCALPIYLYPMQPLATTGLFTVSTVLHFSECHIIGIIQYVSFSDWLLSFSNMHLSFLHGLLAHFVLALDDIPLCGCTTVYLLIYLLKDILLACRFWQLWIKLL